MNTARYILRGLASLWLLLPMSAAQADLIWHWRDSFSAAEREKLQTWIERTATVVEQRVAPYPFDVHIFFHRRDGRGKPVSWARTRRPRVEGIDFYVDPDHSLQAFLDDWVAPHELSHLLIPYLGRRNAWFSEGFASFMQYQVMREMGVLSDAQLEDKYRSRIEKAARDYRLHRLPFAEAAPKLRRRREYPTMYWGGATYFLNVDRALRQRGGSLLQVLADYVGQYRTQAHRLPELIDTMDQLSRGNIFISSLRAMESRPGFPEYDKLF